jgi:hypothetical protein
MSLTFKAMTSKVNYSPRIVLMLVIALLLIGNVFATDLTFFEEIGSVKQNE